MTETRMKRLKGIQAIATFRGEDERRTQYLLQKGEIPAYKEGGWWITDEDTLLAHHQQRLKERAAS